MRKVIIAVLCAGVYVGSFMGTLKILDMRDARTATKVAQAAQSLR
jgi:hypothetical protein